jgi:CRP-like cAMP-binding protein
MEEPSTYKNTLLSSFDAGVIERLHLKTVRFKVGQEIEDTGKPVQNIYFLEEGMASMTTTFANGMQVEVGMFGFESVIGVSALMGTKLSLNRVYTQVEGWGYRSKLEDALSEFGRGEMFQKLALRYVQAQLVQVTQSAGCNAIHHFDQRLARWLLITADRASTDSFMMSQEFLSHMLGVTRSTVTLTAGRLKKKNLIAYNRGEIRILDRNRLEKTACECYRVTKNHLESFLSFDTQDTA